jgi:hypothetical protein
MPLSTDTIFQWKFIESAVLASWAFLFLIAPLLGAFGLTRGVAWHFYIVTLLLVALFIVLPAVLGSFFAVNLARYLDRRLFQVMAMLSLCLVVAGAALWFRPEPLAAETSETRVLAVLDKLLFRTRFAQFQLLPSYWLTSSVLSWAEGALLAAGYWVLVLLSYVAFFGTLTFTRMGGLFYDAASTVQSRGVCSPVALVPPPPRASSPRRQHPGPSNRSSPVHWLGPDARALMVKDVRMFWRDTTQWAQLRSCSSGIARGLYFQPRAYFSQQFDNPSSDAPRLFLQSRRRARSTSPPSPPVLSYPAILTEGKAALDRRHGASVCRVQRGQAKHWLANITSPPSPSVSSRSPVTCSKCRSCPHALLGVAVTVMTLTLTGLAVASARFIRIPKEENPQQDRQRFCGTFCLVLSLSLYPWFGRCLALATPWMRPECHVPARRLELPRRVCRALFRRRTAVPFNGMGAAPRARVWRGRCRPNSLHVSPVPPTSVRFYGLFVGHSPA